MTWPDLWHHLTLLPSLTPSRTLSLFSLAPTSPTNSSAHSCLALPFFQPFTPFYVVLTPWHQILPISYLALTLWHSPLTSGTPFPCRPLYLSLPPSHSLTSTCSIYIALPYSLNISLPHTKPSRSIIPHSLKLALIPSLLLVWHPHDTWHPHGTTLAKVQMYLWYCLSTFTIDYTNKPKKVGYNSQY